MEEMAIEGILTTHMHHCVSQHGGGKLIGNEIQGNVGVWREILEFEGKSCLF